MYHQLLTKIQLWQPLKLSGSQFSSHIQRKPERTLNLMNNLMAWEEYTFNEQCYNSEWGGWKFSVLENGIWRWHDTIGRYDMDSHEIEF